MTAHVTTIRPTGWSCTCDVQRQRSAEPMSTEVATAEGLAHAQGAALAGVRHDVRDETSEASQ